MRETRPMDSTRTISEGSQAGNHCRVAAGNHDAGSEGDCLAFVEEDNPEITRIVMAAIGNAVHGLRVPSEAEKSAHRFGVVRKRNGRHPFPVRAICGECD